MKLFSHNTPVADAIMHHPELVMILERLSIPLGVHEYSIQELADHHNINPALLLSLFNLQIHKLFDNTQPFTKQDARHIIDYLKCSHDYYTREFYPEISELIEKLIKGNNQTEFKMLRQFFDDYRQEVEQHFAYENDTVFPYMDFLLNKEKGNNDFSDYSVEEYKQHHDDIEEKLNDLKSLLVKFLPPSNDIHIRRQIITSLSVLDADLEIHARIENEILIPLVEDLEKEGHNG